MMNKRIFATLISLGMIASMGTMAVRAEEPAATTDPNSGGASVSGSVEGIIDMEVVEATLPTVTNQLGFTVDPQELIQKSAGAKFGTTVTLPAEGSASLLFKTGDTTYANKSSELTITAFNSVLCDISVKATVGDSNKLAFSSTSNFGATALAEGATDAQKAQQAADKKAHLYLAMESSLNAATAVTTAFTDDGLDFKAESVAALGSENFEVKYAEGNYSFSKKADATGKNELKFTLTGASNKNADWTDMAGESVALDFTWSVKKHVDTYLDQTSISSSDLVVEFSDNMGEGTTVTKVDLYNGSTFVKTLAKGTTSSSHYSITAEGIKFISSMTTTYSGQKMVVTFSDGTTEEITIA